MRIKIAPPGILQKPVSDHKIINPIYFFSVDQVIDKMISTS